MQVKQSLEKQKYLKPLFESELKRIYAQFQNDDSCKKFTLQYFFKYADKQLTIYFLKNANIKLSLTIYQMKIKYLNFLIAMKLIKILVIMIWNFIIINI